MGKPLRVLIIEDNADDAELLVRQLVMGGYEPEWQRVETASEMETALKGKEWDIILADYKLPKFSAPKALELMKSKGLDLPFIIVSGTVGEGIIIECMKAGAVDYFKKEEIRLLPLAVEREIADQLERAGRRSAEEALKVSEGRYRALYESSKDAIMTLAPPDWAFTAGNPATVELFGAKDEDEFVAKAPWELSSEYQPDGKPSSVKAKEMIDIAMEKGSNFFEWTHRRFNGEDFPATVLLSKVKAGDDIFLQAIVRDISELKKSQEALARSAEDWAATFDSIPDLVSLHDRDFKFIRVNRAFAKVFDATPEALVGRRCYEVVHGTDHAPEMCPHAETMKSGRIVTKEFFEPKLGLFLQATTSPIYDKSRKMIGSVHVCSDISDRKRMEERLKRINECLMGLTSDYDRNINALTELAGEVLLADCALYNYFTGDLICTHSKWRAPEDMKREDRAEGHICFDVVHAEGSDVMVVKNLPESKYAKSDPNVMAYGLRTYIGKAVRAHGGNVGSLCAVFTKDVEISDDERRLLTIIATAIGAEEERKIVQIEISKSEEKYRTIVENIHDLIYSCGMDGVITFISPNVVDFGYTEDDIIGHNLAEFVHPDDLAAVKSDLEIAFTSGKEFPTECRIRKKSGEYFFAEEVDRIVGTDAGDKMILGVIRDITERKRSELDLKKSREEISEWSRVLEDRVAERTVELEKAQKRIVEQEKLAVVGQIAASISHELRTPLTGIKNSTYFLKMLGLEKTGPKVAENISLIDMEVDACVRVLNNMLDFVRPKMPIKKPSRIDMIVKTTLSNIVMPASISVGVDLPEETPSIMFDAFQIQQVFENIIKNAVDAMGMGGKLNIKAFIEGKEMVVKFADTGIGISPVNINKIFDPLYSTTPTGTGLGLTVTRQLVEAHGGTIEVESEPGKGSVFTIRLPIE